METGRVFCAVVISNGGVRLDAEQLLGIPDARVIRMEVARTERSGCAALLLQSVHEPRRWVARHRGWAGARGWIVTVASRSEHD